MMLVSMASVVAASMFNCRLNSVAMTRSFMRSTSVWASTLIVSAFASARAIEVILFASTLFFAKPTSRVRVGSAMAPTIRPNARAISFAAGDFANFPKPKRSVTARPEVDPGASEENNPFRRLRRSP
jgi:hypothetical protein